MGPDSGRTADDVPERFVVDFTGRTLLGIYRIEQKLAEGGMGSVYLATDTNLDRRVVVKVPHARFLGEPGFRARFGREISELVRLEHPHVVRILARGEEDGVPFFVLQYLGGGSLEGRLEEGPQTPGAALAWLDTIAKTLDFVHSRGVVHRDVKPANILFDEEGHVFLSDFGVVKALDTESSPELTAAGTGIGSPIYMAPEQGLARGVTGAADQYALAATTYEALVGEPPFGRGTPVELILRKDREEPPSLVGRLPGWTAEADGVLRRGLARDPAARHPSCVAFVEALRAATAPPASDAATPRRAGLVALAALLVAAAAVGAGTHWFGLAAPSPDAVAKMGHPDRVLQVVETGAAPKKLLRYRLKAGARDVLAAKNSQKMKQKFGEETNSHELVASQDTEVTVHSVGQDGRAASTWLVRKGTITTSSGTSPQLAERQERMLEAVGDATVTATLWPDGYVSDVVVKTEHELGPEFEQATAGIEEGVELSTVPLPDVPVGPGAVWDVTRFAKVMGIRYQQTATFELLEVDGDRLKFKFSVVMTAPVQGIRFPLAPPEAKTSVKKFVSESHGTMEVDLGHAAPTGYDVKGTVQFVILVGEADAGGPDVVMDLDMTMSAARR